MEVPTAPSPEKEREQAYTKRFLDAAKILRTRYTPEQKFAEGEKKLANILHENWRSAYKANPDNWIGDKLKPRWKSVDDPDWLNRAENSEDPLHQFFRLNPQTNQSEVDIALASNDQLPLNRRQENDEAAKFAIGQIRSAMMPPGDEMDEGFLVGASHEVHEAWKKRNTWARGDKQLMTAYRDLPLVEKLKDMEHVVLAAEVLAGKK